MNRKTIKKICDATGLVYEQSEDPADSSFFLWDPWPVYKKKEWVPGWCNCSHPDEVYEWMSINAGKNKDIYEAMKTVGLKPKKGNM
jgi:hypothetical protein